MGIDRWKKQVEKVHGMVYRKYEESVMARVVGTARKWMMRKTWSKKESNPRTDEERIKRPRRKVTLNMREQEYKFCSNFIRTMKYTVLSFLPLYLLEVRQLPPGDGSTNSPSRHITGI